MEESEKMGKIKSSGNWLKNTWRNNPTNIIHSHLIQDLFI
jgi:hypothetical protein